MGLDIKTIENDYRKGKYSVSFYAEFQDMLALAKLPHDYIFDEDLSVKRNRELVEEHNQKVEQQRMLKREKQAELDRKLTEDVVDYILENYNLTSKQARMVESRVYSDYHSCMSDYFYYIDSFAEFADDLVNQVEED